MKLRTASIMLAVTAALLPSSNAQEYDDPAIAACEFILLQGKEAPTGYERTSAEIAGLNVTIRYTVQVLNVQPRSKEHTCEYELRPDGSFAPKLPTQPAAVTACNVKIDGFKLEEFETLSSTERAKVKAEVEACQATLADYMTSTLKLLTDVYLPLETMELMTISRSDTDLTAP